MSPGESHAIVGPGFGRWALAALWALGCAGDGFTP